MRRTAIALVFLACGLVLSEPASACWKCTQKLRCYGQDCWTEWVCISNLVYPQLGWPECWESFYGCSTSGEVCRWAALPGPEKEDLFPLLQETPGTMERPPLCAGS
jgi:hypothetical protein